MTTLSINADRLLGRVRELGQIGRDSAGRLVRLAGSDADKVGRDLFVTWMHNAGLEVAVDRIGNIFGIWNGSANARDVPVLMGSHLDTVIDGGIYDGCYGVYAGGLSVEEALATLSTDGNILGRELQRIGYGGSEKPGFRKPHAYIELHIEQGPVLEREGVPIGAVQNVQGISWQRVIIEGDANHAGTTPMSMHRDAGHAAARVVAFLRGASFGLQL
jgi:N-carbamoyl-L-amino-acid hydrolase